jgi:hypothetical protein
MGAQHVQHCLLAEGDIGAPIYWRTDAPPATLLAHRSQYEGTDTLGIINKFYIAYWRTEHKKSKKEADRTFRCASPIFTPIASWALQTGNGNTLKKRRRQH